MRIVQLTPGSGDSFYCENCLRDKELLRGLRALGHNALIVPLYLPVSLERGQGEELPIFFGGVNVYLQQKSALFRHTPRWIDRLFDGRGLLRLAGRLQGMTSARVLGETTLSMLAGADGRQRKELRRLTKWLAANHRPEVVCLSNALLAGLARPLRQALGKDVKIACFLQDEDEFLDALEPDHRRLAWERIASAAAEIDLFFPVSRYYADFMSMRLGVPESKMHVVHAGVSPEDYSPAQAAPQPPVLGYLSPLIHGKGLDLLAGAFVLLKKDKRFRGVRLRAAGGGTSGNKAFVEGVRSRLEEAGVWGDVEFLPNPVPADRREFLRGLSVLCVPERRGEAGAVCVLEAMAAGVPVVQPRMGAAPELIEATGGGVLCESAEPEALAEAIGRLLADEPRRRELGAKGRRGIEEGFTARHSAEKVAAALEKAL